MTSQRITFYIKASTNHISISSIHCINPDASMAEERWTTQVADEATADAIAAEFPKSYKVRGQAMRSYNTEHRGEAIVHGVAMRDVHLSADGVNGGTNEAGIARVARFVRKARQLGHTVEILDTVGVYANGVTAEDAAALIGVER